MRLKNGRAGVSRSVACAPRSSQRRRHLASTAVGSEGSKSQASRALGAELRASEGCASHTVAASGYIAGPSVLQALLGLAAAVASGGRTRASILDGCRLSRARVGVFAHRDLADLESRLRRA